MLRNNILFAFVIILIQTIPVIAVYDVSYNFQADSYVPNGYRPYQMQINITNGTGINTDNELFVQCWSVNCQELGFSLDNTTNLHYYLNQNITGNLGKGSAYVNVTGNGTVNVRYGKSGIGTYNNSEEGNKTFRFFDDFNRSDSPIGNGWTVVKGSANVVSNKLVATSSGAGFLTLTKQYATKRIGTALILGQYMAVSSDQFGAFVGSSGGDYYADGLGIWMATNGNTIKIYDNGIQQGSTSFAYNIGTIYNYEVDIESDGSINAYVWNMNNSKPVTANLNIAAFTSASTGNLYKLSTSDSGTVSRTIDNTIIKDHLSPQPVFSTWILEIITPIIYTSINFIRKYEWVIG